ncbi:MAG TPA: tRNA (N6-isopentenyl adenosine(37)-C2)-methylthiotransferase MiaB, partial [bacterium]|nr:tRNA (N6-isopentenyl adenosine(37)-C2)-methylthiotransferase MiaB [bacterium]
TCTIRAKSHHKAISEIGRARVYKENRPRTIVGVCGCVAQEEGASLFERYPHIDIMFGPDQIPRLAELLAEAAAGRRAAALDLIDDPSEYRFLGIAENPESRISGLEYQPAEFVSIMKGCNCACSYCIVPSVRGREVCRAPNDIIREIALLAASKTKEVTLLGQNVNAYEHKGTGNGDRGTGTTFASLLRRIAEETEVSRIRFTSPHPRDVGDDLVREYAENAKLMPHIHLPVQAGSNAVLKKMRRGYTRERYLEICNKLRRARPEISITTDLIVGFCGETEADFEDTLSLMREVDFDSAFAFKYSPRPGTEAAEKMPDDVPTAEKDRRLAKLLSMQLDASRRKNAAQTGRTFEALATGTDKMKRGLVTGRLPDNRIVHFAGQPSLVGTMVPVRITAAHANSLAGEIVEA